MPESSDGNWLLAPLKCVCTGRISVAPKAPSPSPAATESLTQPAPLVCFVSHEFTPFATPPSPGLWQLGIDAQDLTSQITRLAEQLDAEDEATRAEAIAELEAALLGEEGNRQALVAKADATSPAGAPANPAMAPLDPQTIQRLLGTLRALPRPALEGFTKAFRKRFQVPGDAISIADRITQKRHHDWIEAWLVQHHVPPAPGPRQDQPAVA
ncbi:MAG: hypothetical protein VKI81_06730 [Synechococcaceae cyanobacterium]|nr:hypothetical protein [Synechococcaceae cyanobacterium]